MVQSVRRPQKKSFSWVCWYCHSFHSMAVLLQYTAWLLQPWPEQQEILFLILVFFSETSSCPVSASPCLAGWLRCSSAWGLIGKSAAHMGCCWLGCEFHGWSEPAVMCKAPSAASQGSSACHQHPEPHFRKRNFDFDCKGSVDCIALTDK